MWMRRARVRYTSIAGSFLFSAYAASGAPASIHMSFKVFCFMVMLYNAIYPSSIISCTRRTFKQGDAKSSRSVELAEPQRLEVEPGAEQGNTLVRP